MIAALWIWAASSSAALFESFEYSVPPPGWTKTNLLGGMGWYRLPVGTMPLPGWGNGTSTVPPTANAGSANAYCSWTTGGGASEGYHSDQWLISPLLNGLTATSKLSYWIRFSFTNFPDLMYVRISTNGPSPSAFTIVAYTNVFARGSWISQFKPWTNCVVALDAFGIAPGTPLRIAFEEYEQDNTRNESALELDVVSSDLTPHPEAVLGSTQLTFVANYSSNPANSLLSVINSGSTALSFSNSVVYGPGATGWLSLEPRSGDIDVMRSSTITGVVSSSSVNVGTYSATVLVSVVDYTNNPLRLPVVLTIGKASQTILFPNPGTQMVTNRVGLTATARSGLPVSFRVDAGNAVISGGTNLSFTAGDGLVGIRASQAGNSNWNGAADVTNTFAVEKITGAVQLYYLLQTFDGTEHWIAAGTTPPGLGVAITYSGYPYAPTNAGTYAVTGTISDLFYQGIQVATLVVARAAQTLSFPSIPDQLATNTVRLAATVSSGLPAEFSVESGPGIIAEGTNLSFTGAGDVVVVAAQPGDLNHLPVSATNRFAVTRVAATISLSDLDQVYDGTPRIPTATTEPPGLSVRFTYNGVSNPAVAVGTYSVTGTIDQVQYQGSTFGTLTVRKADQTIVFPSPGARLTNETVALAATASSGLPVTQFAVLSGPASIDGTNLSFSGAGDVTLVASQAGDSNWNPAPPATNGVKAFAVNPRCGPAAGGNTVLITNGRIGDGSSITGVTLCGVPATILDQAVHWVLVRCEPGGAGTSNIVIHSDTEIVIRDAYTYNAPGVIDSVEPARGSYRGGYAVTIVGSNLCDGVDATNVTLCGVAAAVVRQSATQLVVTAGAGSLGTGDVRVCSVHFGETTASNAFVYSTPEMAVIGTNGAVIETAAAADLANGTDFGTPFVLASYTNWFSITNSGDAALGISGVTTSGWQASAFSIRDVPSSIPPRTAASFAIVYAPPTVSAYSASMAIANDGTNSPFVLNLAGHAIRRPQASLIFNPASPQVYNTTNTLTTSGGSGTGALTYAVQSGPGEIVGEDGLKLLAGTGIVNVVATKEGDSMYDGAATAAFVTAAKADQGIAFPAIPAQYTTNRLGLAVSADSGLAVALDIVSGPAQLAEGTNVSFTGTGTVAISASQNGDTNWNPAPAATNVFEVVKAVAGVTLSGLAQTYDGTARVVTGTTEPVGRTVDVTYDGSAAPPVNAGSYTVTGEVRDAMYQGTNVGTLVVAKASQGIAFPNPGPQLVTNLVGLAATADSGFAASFAVLSGPAVLSGGTNLTFIWSGRVTVIASQSGDTNWSSAPSVTNSFEVRALVPTVAAPAATNGNAETAQWTADLVALNGGEATERGFFWSATNGFADGTGTRVSETGLFGAGTFTQDVSGLLSGVTNYFKGFAVNNGGTGYTAQASILMKPAAPAVEPAMNVGPTRFDAAWNAARGATNYFLDVAPTSSFAVFVAGYGNRPTGPVVAQSVTGLAEGATYFYRVRAQNAAGTSTNSAAMSVLTQPILTILCWPRAGGSTLPATGNHATAYGVATTIVAAARNGFLFSEWTSIGGTLADPACATTTVTLLSNSIVTAWFAQSVSGSVSVVFTNWVLRPASGTYVGAFQLCNTSPAGARLAAPFRYCVQTSALYRLMYPNGIDPITGFPYVNITAQVESQLTDGILDPGECVGVTNIEFYSKNLSTPSNLVWRVTATQLPPVEGMDSDGDSMPDAWEDQYAPTLNKYNAFDGTTDPDGDFIPSGNEWTCGTDPTNGASFLRVDTMATVAGGAHRVMWPAVSGRVYQVFGATNVAGPFDVLSGNLTATPPANGFTDSTHNADRILIYRIDARGP